MGLNPLVQLNPEQSRPASILNLRGYSSDLRNPPNNGTKLVLFPSWKAPALGQ